MDYFIRQMGMKTTLATILIGLMRKSVAIA